MIDDHHDESEDEHAVPFWAYSDDEDLDDVRGEFTPSAWDDGEPWPIGLGDPDDVVSAPWAQLGSAREPQTRSDLERVLDGRRASWTAYRDAARAATRIGAWDLVEKAAVLALQVAHTQQFGYAGTLSQVARQVLVAKCATATLHGLETALADGATLLRAVVNDARREGRSTLADAVDGEIELAAALLLLLTDLGNAAALTSLAGKLRQLGRADLAEQTATSAIELEDQNPAPWVARAAARADQRNHRGALADLDQPILTGNTMAAVTRIRVLRTVGRLREALDLALRTAEREPSRHTLTMLRLLANDLGDAEAQATAARLYEQAYGPSPEAPTARLLGMLAAEQLAREGDHQAALLLGQVVAAEGPRWTRADNFVTRVERDLR